MTKPKAIIIYTGGTIGMVQDSHTGALMPVNFDLLQANIPEIKKLDIELEIITLSQTFDSSNVTISNWLNLINIIEEKYNEADGFVILHGSDTMAHSASALSFLIENLSKPIIFTGSQLPIGVLRTDAKENFITALEIAVTKKNGEPIVSEVCIYFEYHLMKGNRTVKYSSSHFNAFRSMNYPNMAEAGVQIKFNEPILRKHNGKPTIFRHQMDDNVGILKVFPGMNENYVGTILSILGLKALVMETFGSGNAPTSEWFINLLKNAIDKGLIICNVTQCPKGSVFLGKYKTSEQLAEIGVLNGYDITTESALSKLMYLLAQVPDRNEVKRLFQLPLREEMTVGEWN